MSLLDIFIKDNGNNGLIHRIGDSPHDSLYVDEKGVVQYYNMQNGEGTLGDYEFVPSMDGELLSETDKQNLLQKPEPAPLHSVQEWDGKNCPCCGVCVISSMLFAFCPKCDWHVGNMPSDKMKQTLVKLFADDE